MHKCGSKNGVEEFLCNIVRILIRLISNGYRTLPFLHTILQLITGALYGCAVAYFINKHCGRLWLLSQNFFGNKAFIQRVYSRFYDRFNRMDFSLLGRNGTGKRLQHEYECK